jgi:hypothetical protein
MVPVPELLPAKDELGAVLYRILNERADPSRALLCGHGTIGNAWRVRENTKAPHVPGSKPCPNLSSEIFSFIILTNLLTTDLCTNTRLAHMQFVCSES